jgi:hypothetical protein
MVSRIAGDGRTAQRSAVLAVISRVPVIESSAPPFPILRTAILRSRLQASLLRTWSARQPQLPN